MQSCHFIMNQIYSLKSEFDLRLINNLKLIIIETHDLIHQMLHVHIDFCTSIKI